MSKLSSSMLKLLKRVFDTNSSISVIDAGAYKGDFTSALIENFSSIEATLFEPNPKTYEALRQRFQGDQSIKVINSALSDRPQTLDFYLTQDSATDSLLLPVDSFLSKTQTQVESIDSFFNTQSSLNKLDFIKIDTQGNDVRVLQGATNVIQKYLPLILVEAIFIPLYQNQSSYYEIFDFMKLHNYQLCGIYDAHYSESDQIAFCDFLFSPSTLFSQSSVGNQSFICHDVDQLLYQNQVLKTACDERLALIDQLNQVAEERLEVIQILDAEVRRLREKINQLSNGR